MENDVKEFLSELLKQLKSIDYIKPEDIPNIDLYMDQVTTFMDEQLQLFAKAGDLLLLYPGNADILTGTLSLRHILSIICQDSVFTMEEIISAQSAGAVCQ